MMENRSACIRSIPSMKNVLAFLFLVLSFHAYAQQTLIATVEISDVESAYVDRPGDLYILQKNNTIKKYDTLGALVSEYVFPESPVAFDPRDGARLFACFTSTKKCSFFSAETKNEFRIEPQYAIEPHLITSSGDHNWWILDQSDVSLKRINPVQSSVLADALIDQKQFTQTPEFVFMREYQNFLFLVEKKSGLLIFNSLGKQIKKIPAAGVEYINFLGEELYYKKKGTLFFYDLFDASTREMAVDPACRYILLTDARKYLVYGDRLEIHRNR
jgi:hypothetical protein